MSAADRLPAEDLEQYAEPIEKARQGWTFAEIADAYGEEAAINAGIAIDPDAAPVEVEGFKGHRPLAEVHPELAAASKSGQLRRRVRGRQKAPTKTRVSIRLDADIVDRLRASGPGWQTRLNDLLRDSIAMVPTPGVDYGGAPGRLTDIPEDKP